MMIRAGADARDGAGFSVRIDAVTQTDGTRRGDGFLRKELLADQTILAQSAVFSSRGCKGNDEFAGSMRCLGGFKRFCFSATAGFFRCSRFGTGGFLEYGFSAPDMCVFGIIGCSVGLGVAEGDHVLSVLTCNRIGDCATVDAVLLDRIEKFILIRAAL